MDYIGDHAGGSKVKQEKQPLLGIVEEAEKEDEISYPLASSCPSISRLLIFAQHDQREKSKDTCERPLVLIQNTGRKWILEQIGN